MPAQLLQRLSTLFRGLDRAYGVFQMLERKSGGKKVPGKARTAKGEVTAALWAAHLAGTQGLGIVPIMDDAKCWFGAIDVDKYDIRMEELETQCATLGFPLLPTRTKSGGVHLYLFMQEALPAKLVRERLGEWSVALGHGGAEIFPKQDSLANGLDTGNWINMPYFGAEASQTERYGILNGVPLSLAAFCDRAESLRVTEQMLADLSLPPEDDFLEGPPCLQSLSKGGFGEGMRNNGMFAVGVYLKKRFPDDWKTKLQVYNSTYMKPPLPVDEVVVISKALGRKDYNYTCDKPPIKNYCNRNLCRTREHGVGRGLDDWGVVIDSDVQRVNTKPPSWYVTINGVRVQLTSDDLMQQRNFQKVCMEQVGMFPVALPSDKWRAEVNKILQSAEVVEAPLEASHSGELAYHLKQFCTVYPQAETREELLVGKPYTENKLTHFRAADFKKYLESQHFKAFTGKQLYMELREMGVTFKQFWVAEQNVAVWAVKVYDTPMPVVPERVSKDEGAM